MQTHNNGATMRKVLRHIRKYWFYFMLSLLFAAVTVTLTLYLPILIGEAVDLILDPGQVDFEGKMCIRDRDLRLYAPLRMLPAGRGS